MKTYRGSIHVGALILLVLAGCGDERLLEPPDVQLTVLNQQAAGVPTVVVRDGPGGGSANAPVVRTIEEALARVAPGGTIQVTPGTYEAHDIAIDKAVSIRGTGQGRVRFVTPADPHSAGFAVNLTGPGTVELRGVEIVVIGDGADGIRIGPEYDQVVIRDVAFRLAGEAWALRAQRAWGSAPAGHVLVERSEFHGGAVGVEASSGAAVSVRDSRFLGHNLVAVRFQHTEGGLVEGSTFEECGGIGCIQVSAATADVVDNVLRVSRSDVDPHHSVISYDADEAVLLGVIAGNVIDGCGRGDCITLWTQAAAVVTANRITARTGDGTSTGISAGGASGRFGVLRRIHGNTITGVGSVAFPGDPASYAFQHAGIAVNGEGVTADVVGNVVRNAAIGINVSNGATLAAGTDNTIDLVHTGVVIGVTSRGLLTRSDLTRYEVPLVVDVQADPETELSLRCNWWGSPDGPRGAPEWVPAGFYTPWAAAPIAGTQATCVPVPADGRI